MNPPEIKTVVVKQISLASSSPLKEVEPQRKKQLHSSMDKLSTVLIDYGSETIMAGLENNSHPDLIFRPQISKNRDLSKSDLPIKAYINTSYDQLDFLKQNYKSPFERNLILHFGLIEQCNDYIFSELQKGPKRIRNPFIITEALANPLHCRSSFLEQIFECYQIDSVMIGVDALFAYFFELDCSISRYQTESALVINFGATSIHVMAVVNGKMQANSVYRLNVGGNTAFDLFGKSILLKNPHLKDRINYTLLRHLYENYTSVAIDFKLQLKYFESAFIPALNNTIYRNKIEEENKSEVEKLEFISGMQFDFDQPTQVPEEDLKRKEQIRKRMSQKLKDTLNRRKQIKKKAQEEELTNLIQLKQRFKDHDNFAHEEVVQIFGDHHPLDKLEKKIKAIEVKLGLIEEKTEATKFNLITIPDHQLPPEKLKYKKLQIYQKQAIQVRRQRQIEKEEDELKMKDLRQNNPELYLHQLKESYKNLSGKIKEDERIRSELSNRKSKLKQRKMQAIARLAEQEYDSQQEQGEDDWLVFKDLEQSDHYSELEAMEAELRQIDPEWTQSKDHHHLKQNNQLYLLTDLVKCHEIYFQPMMIGLNQLNLVTAIVRSVEGLPQNTKEQLRNNIVLVGGGSQVPGLSARLKRDLIRESPAGSKIEVKVGKGGSKGAFHGMQYLAKYEKELVQGFSFKKDEFMHKRQKYFVENPWSNPEPKI